MTYRDKFYNYQGFAYLPVKLRHFIIHIHIPYRLLVVHKCLLIKHTKTLKGAAIDLIDRAECGCNTRTSLLQSTADYCLKFRINSFCLLQKKLKLKKWNSQFINNFKKRDPSIPCADCEETTFKTLLSLVL